MKITPKIFILAALFTIQLVLPSLAAAAPAEKEWSIMVFLNGDNNLDSFGTKDMKEMEKVGSDANVNIIVLRDTNSTAITSKIYYVEKGKSTAVKDYKSNIDMGDWHNMVDFFKYVKENYPAKRYLMDIWNHGSGWKFKNADPLTRGISYDDHSGNHISTPQLREAFGQMKDYNDGRNIDILGMDACLMQMAEVAYEVKDSVDVVVGSEQTEPGDGWPYDKFLEPLVLKPTMDAAELGTVLESEYTKSYNGGSQGTQPAQGSVVSTAKLVSALGAFDEYLDLLIALVPANKSAISSAVSATQKYYYSDYKDIQHFVALLKDGIKTEQFQAASDKLLAQFGEAVIANFVVGSGLGNSKGFSIWLPDKSQYGSKKALYSELKWVADTKWETFLENYLYPNTPVVTVQSVEYSDESADGFLSVGEKAVFKVTLNNDSSVAAKNVRVELIPPAGVAGPYTGHVEVAELPNGDRVIEGLNAVIAADAAPGAYTFKIKVVMPGYGEIEKEVPVGVDPAYTLEDHALSSPHDYTASYDNTWTITKGGASGMRVHFGKFETEKAYDFVYIYDKDGKEIAKFHGKLLPFWTPMVPGDTVKIRLKSDNIINKYGFDIDKIAY